MYKLKKICSVAFEIPLVFVAIACLSFPLIVIAMPLPIRAIEILIACSFLWAKALSLEAVWNYKNKTISSCLFWYCFFSFAVEFASLRMILMFGTAENKIPFLRYFANHQLNYIVDSSVSLLLLFFVLLLIRIKFCRMEMSIARILFTAIPQPCDEQCIQEQFRTNKITEEEKDRTIKNTRIEHKFIDESQCLIKVFKINVMAPLCIFVLTLAGGIAIGHYQYHLSFKAAIQQYAMPVTLTTCMVFVPIMMLYSGMVYKRENYVPKTAFKDQAV
ncbi:MAG: FHIPEP family type III secretion protein [Treponema phagedenis]|uniref:FHIPEP family type III secretion protein n=1 Tax=Treponema phagedenis TaxID=162 RepID=UPI00313421E9